MHSFKRIQQARQALRDEHTQGGGAISTAAAAPVRTISDHVVNPANDKLTISAVDAPGSGGANHLYMVEGFDTASNPSDPFVKRHGQPARHTTILFQNGPIAEVGVNGITQEVLLAIVADRLRSFQAGPYACRENALALTKIEEAQHWLQQRPLARMRRGVEGTHTI
ncbi:hypothetical protein [Burkholderia cepacia]|uniref:hypothetical protein n=1 Tax=Burkholderia cepacia TaxID=292 RepID=UPI002AB7D074|nr:hypothetical protein [Burkholderia cepacia]